MSKYSIALTGALGVFPVALDLTIVNVATIPISKALNTDLTTIQWIGIGYILASAAMVSLSGYLGSRFGVKRLFMLGIALFGLFSILCGLAPDIGWLIAFRVFQGIGGGLIIPLAMAISLNPFPKEERTKAAALTFTPVLLAPVFGPIVGGLIVDNLNWQTIFLVNIPICLIALFLAWRILPADEVEKSSEQASFDYPGLVLSTLSIVTIVYAFKLVSQTNPDSKTPLNPVGDIYGWGYWLVWVLLGTGFVLLTAFAIQALRFSRDPVMDLRLFKDYSFSISNLLNWFASTVSFGVLFLVPTFFQQIRQPSLSAVDTGLALMPMGLATIVGLVLGSRLYNKVGARPLVLLGSGLFVVSFWQLSNLSSTTSSSDIWPWLVLLGLGTALTSFILQTLAVLNLEGVALNKGSSLVQSTKSIFGAVGPAILVTTLVQQTTYHATQLKDTLSSQSTDPASRQHLASQAGTNAMNDVFTALIYVALGLLVLSLALPGGKPREILVEAESETLETAMTGVH